jgi:hypothetical protein
MLPEHGKLPDYSDAVTRYVAMSPVHSSTNPPQHRDWLVGEKNGGIASVSTVQTRGLSRLAASLARNLVSLNPIDTVIAGLSSSRQTNAAKSCAGTCTVELLRTAEIEKCLVDRHLFDKGHRLQHLVASARPTSLYSPHRAG